MNFIWKCDFPLKNDFFLHIFMVFQFELNTKSHTRMSNFLSSKKWDASMAILAHQCIYEHGQDKPWPGDIKLNFFKTLFFFEFWTPCPTVQPQKATFIHILYEAILKLAAIYRKKLVELGHPLFALGCIEFFFHPNKWKHHRRPSIFIWTAFRLQIFRLKSQSAWWKIAMTFNVCLNLTSDDMD